MLDQAFEGFPSEVEAIEVGIAALQPGHHGERLGIVVKAAPRREATGERALAGMTERRMAEIVAQGGSLGEVFVELERAGERTRDLGHFQRVGQAGAVVVTLVEDEDLGLVGKPAKRG